VSRALVGLMTAVLGPVMAIVLLAPVAVASPIGDAEAAMMSAWEKAGGDTSPLGARKGDVYPAGEGFALEFAGGKMYFTPETGPNFVYGPILDKYESLGGPAGSDLGFPTITETPGLAGPDSRVATFSASDKPVIFWAADRGAFVVRGVINAAWDKLGSSGGVLGVPVGDETYDADAVSQKFSGGSVSWNRKTKAFTAEPAALGEQLKSLQVAPDPTAAINMAWRAAGGASGPLGAKQGPQNQLGGDGVSQDFAGGKVYYNPATGANAVESDILAKYESLGGPAGSDLGFPVANESDGGIPTSRVVTFSAADKPMIFWTQQHGAFVVRGAMKAAWDKLKGATGKLGAPLGDQAVDGDVTSQKFTGGKISWNRSKNTYTTDPANLAPLLSGLQAPGQNQPSNTATSPHAKKFAFQWWWLGAGLGALLLIALLVLGVFALLRRRKRPAAPAYEPGPDPDDGYNGYDGEGGYDASADGLWSRDDADPGARRVSLSGVQQTEQLAPEAAAAPKMSWLSRPDEDGGGPADEVAPAEYGAETAPRVGEDRGWFAGESEPDEDDDEDPPTTPIGYEGDLRQQAFGEPGESYEDDEVIHPDADYRDAAYPEAGYRQAGYPEAEAEDDYLENDYLDVEAHPLAAPDPVSDPLADARAGRHAAAAEAAGADVLDMGFEARPPVAPPPDPAARPTIHLPLEDPYQMPDGYPIKASARFGLYYTPSSALYHDTLAEIWLASEEVARANGFVKAD
jgi:uncharacterized protein with LGFP repeats